MLDALPTLIEGMDFPAYLADPAPEPSLTSSLCRQLLQTAPRKVWQTTARLNADFEAEQKSIFDLGSAAHALFVGQGAPLVVVDAPDWRTKAAREQRDAAYAEGKTPIKINDMRRVEAMAFAAVEQCIGHPDLEKLIEDCHREASIFWREDGVTCRCRPDLYAADNDSTVIHYKTTGATISPYTLSRYAASLGWEIIAAHYAAGIAALTGQEPRQFFAVQETEPPYLALVAELDDAFLELGKMRRRRVLKIWAWCLRERKWPGWPSGTVRLEAPPWHENAAVEQRDAEQEAIDAGGLCQEDVKASCCTKDEGRSFGAAL